ncbi:hypothetical protein CK203_105731 [Vitis vinifera]|uniref:Uncharacterized protein n=1 Tax=Vitis vinifera TaxID=29760 RepID=A0A438FKB7_VITVI|nr:hypothetical protein CK203_105731 [Vitis vinifera]
MFPNDSWMMMVNQSPSPSSSSSWSRHQDKLFEQALVVIPEETPTAGTKSLLKSPASHPLRSAATTRTWFTTWRRSTPAEWSCRCTRTTPAAPPGLRLTCGSGGAHRHQPSSHAFAGTHGGVVVPDRATKVRKGGLAEHIKKCGGVENTHQVASHAQKYLCG